MCIYATAKAPLAGEGKLLGISSTFSGNSKKHEIFSELHKKNIKILNCSFLQTLI